MNNNVKKPTTNASREANSSTKLTKGPDPAVMRENGSQSSHSRKNDTPSLTPSPNQQAASANMIEERGTGLGLALVKSLTELHGGRLAVASQEGEGTTVDVFLPLERA